MLSRNLVIVAVLSVAAIIMTVTGVLTPVQAATQLVSHRAIYAVSLSPDSAGGPVLGVDGVMSMSIEETCDGWIFTQDMKTAITVDNGNTINQSALFTSWESLDGREYRFASRVKTGGGQLILRGDARLDQDGSGTASYRVPQEIEIALPKGTFFPVSHTAWLIDEAKAGTRSAPHIVFTGSEDLEAELVNAFIGDFEAPKDYATEGMGELASEGGWPLTMAFYPLASETGVPTFEMRALQLGNGVSPELQMNFGEFSTRMLIQRLEAIERPSCS
ncbi:MAG: DUF1849 family protein [Rhodospirillales bacterium]|nr:DUF1849 family protein [Rhodospirillales bacterium]